MMYTNRKERVLERISMPVCTPTWRIPRSGWPGLKKSKTGSSRRTLFFPSLETDLNMAKILFISVYDVNAEGIRMMSSMLQQSGHQPFIVLMKRLIKKGLCETL
ncbi:MAG: hypothetical protein PVJ13_14575 [Desulfobacterales bacterium]